MGEHLKEIKKDFHTRTNAKGETNIGKERKNKKVGGREGERDGRNIIWVSWQLKCISKG